MRTALVSCTALIVVCAAAFTQENPAQFLFNRLREKVRGNLAKVPRYTCVQTITRAQYMPQYGRRPESCAGMIAAREANPARGLVTWHDRLRLDVAVGADSEIFSWAGARSFESGDLADLAVSGPTGSGDFGSFLASVFGGFADSFRYLGERDISLGHLAAFEYSVPIAKSHYTYRLRNGGKGVIGYGGTFYADPATADLKRLVVDARDFSSGEVCRVLDTMDYSQVKIGTGDYLLPDVSNMVVLYRNGEETANQTHYSGCHEFTGESTIRFDDGEDSDTPAQATKSALKALPPGTPIKVKIDPPINSATAAAGDAITGVVEHDVKQNGVVIVRATDLLRGRILRLEQFLAPEPYWVVAIRFDAIDRGGVEQPLKLRPTDDGDRMPSGTISRLRRIPVPERAAGAGIFLLPGIGNIVLDEKFHSEWKTR
ncbi:MAG: hypothetical protein ABJC09_12130 [Terriglobia bacterium]